MAGIDQAIFYGYGAQIWSGTKLTIEFTVLTVLISMVIGMVVAMAKLTKNRVLRFLGAFYTTAIRSVPDLVLMLLIFYNLQTLINSFCGLINIPIYELDTFSTGVITLSFIYGAFMTETFRGAILAIPKGQVEAAVACGMSSWKIFRIILFPQMMRYAIPGVSNNFQVIIKATAVVSLMALEDIVRVTQYAAGGTHKLFYFSVMAAVIYLLISIVVSIFFYYINRIFSVGTKQVRL